MSHPAAGGHIRNGCALELLEIAALLVVLTAAVALLCVGQPWAYAAAACVGISIVGRAVRGGRW